MDKSKVMVVGIVCVTLVLVAAIGAYVFVSISNQDRLKEQGQQTRSDKIYSECLKRTQQEGYYMDKGGDKEGCRAEPVGR